jgi:cytochrome c oxidase assembly protein subunit 19
MNATQAPSQSKRPPEKGSFPLDHYGECKPAMKEFLACMREHGNTHIDCKKLSAAYLQCRMDKCVPERCD